MQHVTRLLMQIAIAGTILACMQNSAHAGDRERTEELPTATARTDETTRTRYVELVPEGPDTPEGKVVGRIFLELEVDTEPGEVLELWLDAPESQPWAEDQTTRPRKVWPVDARTGSKVRFDVTDLVEEANASLETVVFILRLVDAEDEPVPLNLMTTTPATLRALFRNGP